MAYQPLRGYLMPKFDSFENNDDVFNVPKQSVFKLYIIFFCLVGWGCRIHLLLLYRAVRPSPTSVLDMTLNNLMVRFQ